MTEQTILKVLHIYLYAFPLVVIAFIVMTPQTAKFMSDLNRSLGRRVSIDSTEFLDPYSRSRLSRTGVIVLYLCAPICSQIIYPFSWLFVILAGPLFGVLGWNALKKLNL